MPILLRTLCEGRVTKIYALVELVAAQRVFPPSSSHAVPLPSPRVHCPVADFFAAQQERDKDELKRLQRLIDQVADHGPPVNIEKCRPLTGTQGLFELKTLGGLRLFWFWDEGRVIVCTHGMVKKRQKTPPVEIQRAREWRDKYLNTKNQQGSVPHEKQDR